MSKIAVGVDGGQSSTVCVAVNAQGEVLGTGFGGPSNHITEPGGPERCRKSVHDSVYGALDAAGLSIQDVGFVLCGMTGAFPETEEAVAKALGDTPHKMVHDSVTAYYGATAGRPGAITIGGTGSVAYGENSQGKHLRLGGWGYLMGDEGSAYWIALQAVQAVAKSFEGRAPETILHTMLPEAIGGDDIRALHTWLYGLSDRSEIARLSGTVDAAAQQGDAVAQSILNQAGQELGALATAVLQQLDMTETEASVSYVGGVFKSETARRSFEMTVTDKVPMAQVTAPYLPPVGGAALMALKELGIDGDKQVLATLQQSIRASGIQ